ncbi:MAG: hypothetical protein RKP20_08890, partial [Candidatus Competibacter sp.]|nr:hypothetical protein [Candidatus Competibacter sp.]
MSHSLGGRLRKMPGSGDLPSEGRHRRLPKAGNNAINSTRRSRQTSRERGEITEGNENWMPVGEL